ncbi:MAG: DMT family transporter [Pseudomonadota bacterium]
MKSRVVLGSLLALLSAASFALNLVLASLAYSYGANIHAMNLSRAGLFLCCLCVALMLRRPSMAMPMRARLASAAVGLLLCAEMYVLLGAIQTISVALAVLIFYTYPILIAVVGWVRGSERFFIDSLLFMSGAFLGLVLVLVEASEFPDVQGLTLAVLAALVMATMLITSERVLSRYDHDLVMAHSLLTVTAVVIGLSLTVVDLQWPQSTTGGLIFFGSAVFYVVATFSLFKAVALIGPLRTAIIDTTSPIWAILFGFLLLHQLLTGSQLFGATLVIVAVAALQWSAGSSPERQEPNPSPAAEGES